MSSRWIPCFQASARPRASWVRIDCEHEDASEIVALCSLQLRLQFFVGRLTHHIQPAKGHVVLAGKFAKELQRRKIGASDEWLDGHNSGEVFGRAF